ncbi:MAG: amidase [Microthrixaceae bacterium]
MAPDHDPAPSDAGPAGPPPFGSASEVADAVRRREVSPTEVLDLYLDRIDRIDPELGAIVLRDDERARAEARAAEERLVAGGDLPPFLGVPIPIKDLDDVAGWPTSFGSRSAPDGPAATDSLVVGRLRDAGFVLLGKTATPEFGTISFTESERFGATRNPWDTSRTPGGSSGGAGAAVAAGLAPVAHASDGGGSIRIPASCNGLVGLKPARNRVTDRVEELAAASTSGVVTRTVADTAALLDVLSAADPGAWNHAPPPARPFLREVGADPGRLRIRVTTSNPLGLPVDADVEAALEVAAGLLNSLGHEVDLAPVAWPDAGEFLMGFLTVWSTISSAASIADEALLEAHNRAERDRARATDAIAYVEAVTALQRASRDVTAQFGTELDVLVTPTMAVLPPPVGSVWAGSEDDPTAPIANCTPMATFTALFNVTGQPAISLPLHRTADGLPVGVQFAAAPWREDVLIRLASQIEAAAPWVDRWPALAG